MALQNVQGGSYFLWHPSHEIRLFLSTSEGDFLSMTLTENIQSGWLPLA